MGKRSLGCLVVLIGCGSEPLTPLDGGRPDAGPADAATADAGTADGSSNPRDAGVPDVGAPDAQPPDGGINTPCQTTIDRDVFVQAQADLEALRDVRVITGTLTVAGTIENLDPLECLENVTGALRIRRTTAVSLTGPTTLRSVGHNVEFRENDSLTEVTGFEGLVSVGGDVSFFNNDALATIQGFESLTEVGGIGISGNRGIQSLLAFNALVTVSGSIGIVAAQPSGMSDAFGALTRVDGGFFLGDYPGGLVGVFVRLDSIGGNAVFGPEQTERIELSALTQVGGRLAMRSSNSVTALALPSLIHAGEIDVVGNSELVTLSLPSLETVTATVEVSRNDRLAQVDLTSLSEAQEVLIWNNGAVPRLRSSALTNIAEGLWLMGVDAAQLDLGQLQSVGDLLYFENQNRRFVELTELRSADVVDFLLNTNLTSVVAPRLVACDDIALRENPLLSSASFPALTTVAREFFVATNPQLLNLESPRLRTTGRILISDNDSLATVEAIAGVEQASRIRIVLNDRIRAIEMTATGTISGSLFVFGNLALESITANVARGTRVQIERNAALTSIEMPQLRATSEWFVVLSNEALTTLAAPAFVTVGRELLVADNALLTTVSLPAVDSVGTNLAFTGNASWSTCDAEAIRDQIVARGGVGGRITIAGNAPCQSGD